QHHSAGPKKPSKGPLIALIALLLLVLPVSVYFISQQNQQLADIRSKAAWDTVYQGCTVNPDSCGEGFTCHCQNGNACTYTLCEPNSQTKDSCERQGRAWCINGYNGNAYTCCYPGYQCGANNTGCYETGGDDDNGDDDDTTATPTPTTGNAPVCLNIKLYKDGVQVADLTTLRPGDAVVLAVRGNLNPTKAHFRVNGGAWNETTTKNANDEFTWGHTIADGITDFVIEGEVFTNGAWH
ncbi:hypothetical protein HZB58_00680, partial [Candidatus Gottesmanbacteria bacterium]|nr:hypothetical protein [Candidatus Gottesmanbacteria bacterium]